MLRKSGGSMTAPNMATIAASLERSLQNCSLNHHQSTITGGGGGGSSGSGVVGSSDGLGIGMGRSSSTSSTSDDAQQNQLPNNDTILELNSHVSLPYHWEQCLDIKTGEIYYINWRNGMKAKEDPRTTAEYSGEYYYSEDDDNSSYDSEESSTESSPSSSREREQQQQQHRYQADNSKDHVLVVAGCKGCLMYFMVPKQLEDCPKCSAQLLHFDRSENGSP